MSALQLRIMLEHLLHPIYRDVHVRYVPTNDELRLHIWYTAGNRFHRSFGPDGGFVEIED